MSPYADTASGAGLLEYIVRHPDETQPRLEYADWLEERGEDARAEFIRVQVELAGLQEEWGLDASYEGGTRYKPTPLSARDKEIQERSRALRRRERELLKAGGRDWTPRFNGWGEVVVWDEPRTTAGACFGARDCAVFTFRRGFPEVVELPAQAFAGGPCVACMEPGEDVPDQHCHVCRGKGNPGCATTLFGLAPVTRVVLSDRHPYWNGRGHSLYRVDRERPSPDVPEAATVPDCLFDLLGGGVTRNVRWIAYHTFDHANDALSDACVRFGRNKARRLNSAPASR